MNFRQKINDVQRKVNQDILKHEQRIMSQGFLYRIPSELNTAIIAFSGMSLPRSDEENPFRHFSPENTRRTRLAALFLKKIVAYHRRKHIAHVTHEDVLESNCWLIVIGGGPDQEEAMLVTAKEYLPISAIESIADQKGRSNTKTQSQLLHQHDLVKNSDLLVIISDPAHVVRALHTIARWINIPVTAVSSLEGHTWHTIPRMFHWIGYLGIPISRISFNKEAFELEVQNEPSTKIEDYSQNGDVLMSLPKGYWYGGLTYKPITEYLYVLSLWIKHFILLIGK